MIFGHVWRIISSWKSIITKQSNYVGYIINYFKREMVGEGLDMALVGIYILSYILSVSSGLVG